MKIENFLKILKKEKEHLKFRIKSLKEKEKGINVYQGDTEQKVRKKKNKIKKYIDSYNFRIYEINKLREIFEKAKLNKTGGKNANN